MLLEIVIEEQADLDIDDITRYIANSNMSAAERFNESLFATFDLLAFMPNLGRREDFGIPKLAGMRMLPLSRFPNYLIFYMASETELHIVRVVHGARDLPNLAW